MARWPSGRNPRLIAILTGGCLALSACAETQLGAQLAKSATRDDQAPRVTPAAIGADPALAPDEFSATGLSIWDGTRTLQGVWVAHPLANRARRVRVINLATGNVVEGAMFRRDPTLSGPSILVSSDAATGLGLKPGAPTELQIVALRDPAAIQAAPVTPAPSAEVETATLPAPAPELATEPVAVPVADAEPVFEPVEDTANAPQDGVATLTPQPVAPVTSPAAEPANITDTTATPDAPAAVPSAPVPQPRPSNVAAATPSPQTAPTGTAAGGQLAKGSYVQAGAFGVEANAAALVAKMRAKGLPAQYVTRRINDRDLNIVMIGPLRGGDIERAVTEAEAAGVTGARKVTL